MLLQDHARSYNAGFINSFNPEVKLEDTDSGIKNKLRKLLTAEDSNL